MVASGDPMVAFMVHLLVEKRDHHFTQMVGSERSGNGQLSRAW